MACASYYLGPCPAPLDEDALKAFAVTLPETAVQDTRFRPHARSAGAPANRRHSTSMATIPGPMTPLPAAAAASLLGTPLAATPVPRTLALARSLKRFARGVPPAAPPAAAAVSRSATGLPPRPARAGVPRVEVPASAHPALGLVGVWAANAAADGADSLPTFFVVAADGAVTDVTSEVLAERAGAAGVDKRDLAAAVDAQVERAAGTRHRLVTTESVDVSLSEPALAGSDWFGGEVDAAPVSGSEESEFCGLLRVQAGLTGPNAGASAWRLVRLGRARAERHLPLAMRQVVAVEWQREPAVPVAGSTSCTTLPYSRCFWRRLSELPPSTQRHLFRFARAVQAGCDLRGAQAVKAEQYPQAEQPPTLQAQAPPANELVDDLSQFEGFEEEEEAARRQRAEAAVAPAVGCRTVPAATAKSAASLSPGRHAAAGGVGPKGLVYLRSPKLVGRTGRQITRLRRAGSGVMRSPGVGSSLGQCPGAAAAAARLASRVGVTRSWHGRGPAGQSPAQRALLRSLGGEPPSIRQLARRSVARHASSVVRNAQKALARRARKSTTSSASFCSSAPMCRTSSSVRKRLGAVDGMWPTTVDAACARRATELTGSVDGVESVGGLHDLVPSIGDGVDEDACASRAVPEPSPEIPPLSDRLGAAFSQTTAALDANGLFGGDGMDVLADGFGDRLFDTGGGQAGEDVDSQVLPHLPVAPVTPAHAGQYRLAPPTRGAMWSESPSRSIPRSARGAVRWADAESFDMFVDDDDDTAPLSPPRHGASTFPGFAPGAVDSHLTIHQAGAGAPSPSPSSSSSSLSSVQSSPDSCSQPLGRVPELGTLLGSAAVADSQASLRDMLQSCDQKRDIDDDDWLAGPLLSSDGSRVVSDGTCDHGPVPPTGATTRGVRSSLPSALRRRDAIWTTTSRKRNVVFSGGMLVGPAGASRASTGPNIGAVASSVASSVASTAATASAFATAPHSSPSFQTSEASLADRRVRQAPSTPRLATGSPAATPAAATPPTAGGGSAFLAPAQSPSAGGAASRTGASRPGTSKGRVLEFEAVLRFGASRRPQTTKTAFGYAASPAAGARASTAWFGLAAAAAGAADA